ncbi:hypothetical protein FY036_15975 [Mesorhizobium microcysteis]|uniref:DUF6602 domain-containing protein n=1 Tax=Neoaquamicrobium microcysteis TaxID=2682781 RepID=A0A5D4GWL4_9HYPH|nr:DUF6602 domain-containing protein [Mesorhizobium microcysteis]TYR30940.1 hypothetical protein FY036_15975 [Mesorhizobium microcysteis]
MGKTIQLGMPRKIEPLFTRVSAVKDGLLAAHKAGSGSPNEVIGNEREVFIRNYLEAAYPKPFRFAGGFVTDSEGRKSGQLDIIVEKFHSISFPAQAGSSERLYLAEMVSAAISVKSNLSAQWKQVTSEIDKLDPVKSDPTGFFQVNAHSGSVPFFVLSYSGAQTLESLGEKLDALPKNNCLKAVAVLDSNIFAVQTSPNRWVCNQDESSFFYFIAQLHDEITRNFTVAESIWKYACEITDHK